MDIKPKVQALADALIKATKEAMKYIGIDDGGTCNFDAPVINLKGWRKDDVAKSFELADLRFYKDDYSYYKGWYHIIGKNLSGQGLRRTKMAEAFEQSLKADGYDVSVYYQVD